MKSLFSILLSLTLFAFFSFSVSAQEKEVTLEEVVVTATKISETRKDIPNAVIIMDDTDIQISGAKTLGELLANELGIDLRTYGNYGGAAQEIHIRGMRGNATQVFVNGVSVNSPSLGTADIGKIPLTNIERIEVVKGSGSLLYGSGAMGGIVNIITKRPDRGKMDLEVGAGYGSQNTYRLSAENGMFFAGDFGYYITAGRTETDGFRDNSYLKQNDLSMKLILEKKEAIDISLYGDYIDRKYGQPGVKPPSGMQDYYRGGIKFYNSEAASLLDKGGDEDGRVILEAKGKPMTWLSYNLKGHYTNMENYYYRRYASDGTGQETWVTNEVLGTDGHLVVSPFEGAKLLMGGEYKDFNWNNEGYNLNASGSRTGSKTKTKADLFTKGAFTEAQYRPSKYLKALAGFRYEDHSAFGSENLPFFGLVVNPFETTALKVNHGKHFLAPTPNDLYWPADPYTKGNLNLKPETGWHTDVTLEQSFLKDKIFVSMSYFHWNVNDKIQWEPDAQGVWSPVNLGKYKADGIEIGTKVGPFYDLTLALSYTYTDAEEKSREYTRQDYGWPPFFPPDFRYSMVNRRATYTPKYLFKGDLIYRCNFGLTVTTTTRYVGNRVMYETKYTTYPETTTITHPLKSYWTTDLKVEQRLFKHWVLSLYGTNLFNKYYDTYLGTFYDSAGNGVICGYPGAGRSVFFNLAYSF
jgi:iron complex outermembrane receptor protein